MIDTGTTDVMNRTDRSFS